MHREADVSDYQITVCQRGDKDWEATVNAPSEMEVYDCPIRYDVFFHARTRDKVVAKAEKWIANDRRKKATTETWTA